MNIQLQLDKAADLKKRADYLSENSKSAKEMLRLQAAYNNIYQRLVRFCPINNIDILNGSYQIDECFDYETFPNDVECFGK